MKQTTPAGVSRCGARLLAASNVWAMACALLFAALLRHFRCGTGRRRAENAQADRPFHRGRAADYRSDRHARPPSGWPSDRKGEKRQRPPGVGFRVPRPEGATGRRAGQRFRPVLWLGPLPFQRRAQRRDARWRICPTRSKATPCCRSSPAKRSSWPRMPRSARRASTKRPFRPPCEASIPRSPAGDGRCRWSSRSECSIRRWRSCRSRRTNAT